jgi:hypothetical protein
MGQSVAAKSKTVAMACVKKIGAVSPVVRKNCSWGTEDSFGVACGACGPHPPSRATLATINPNNLMETSLLTSLEGMLSESTLEHGESFTLLLNWLFPLR